MLRLHLSSSRYRHCTEIPDFALGHCLLREAIGAQERKQNEFQYQFVFEADSR